MTSPSRAPDPSVRAKLDELALDLLARVREQFRAYRSELGAQEWAPFYVGEVQRFVSCFEPMIEALVRAHLEYGYGEDQVCPPVFACIVRAVNTPTSDTSRGPEYGSKPEMPATYPWMVSTLFEREEFRSALRGAIARSVAMTKQGQITDEHSKTQQQERHSGQKPRRADFLDRLSPDDPNYQLGRRFYLEAWADSHRLAADMLAGKVSLPQFIESCITTFDQVAGAHVATEDSTPVSQRCQKLDDLAKKFIARITKTVKSHSKTVGKTNVHKSIDRFSRRVNEIAARSKQQIVEEAMGVDPFENEIRARPLGENPFAPNGAFEEATWKAKERIAQAESDYIGAVEKNPSELFQAGLAFRRRWFSIGAHEATLIVGNEETGAWYERWIDDRARFLIDDTIRALKRKDPLSDPASPLPIGKPQLKSIKDNLTLDLMKLVAHYRRIAAARVTEVIDMRAGVRSNSRAEQRLGRGMVPVKSMAATAAAGAQAHVSDWLIEVGKAVRGIELDGSIGESAKAAIAALRSAMENGDIGIADPLGALHSSLDQLHKDAEGIPGELREKYRVFGDVLRELQASVSGSAMTEPHVPDRDRPAPSGRASMPRRRPDLEISYKRLKFFDSIASELATIKQDLNQGCTAVVLKRKHPKFDLWKMLERRELEEIVRGDTFSPKSYAQNLTLRKFGITSSETLKKDRQKVRRAEKAR